MTAENRAGPGSRPRPSAHHNQPNDQNTELRCRLDAISSVCASALAGTWPFDQAAVTTIRLAKRCLQLLEIEEGERQLARTLR